MIWMAVFVAVALIGGCFAFQQWLAQGGTAGVEQMEAEQEDAQAEENFD